jgi:hypothetical protein
MSPAFAFLLLHNPPRAGGFSIFEAIVRVALFFGCYSDVISSADVCWFCRKYVVDSQYAAIVNASVTLKDLSRGLERHTATNIAGEFD